MASIFTLGLRLVMCGIFFSYSRNQPIPPSYACLECLRKRGPDSYSTVSCGSVLTDNAPQDLLGELEANPISLDIVSTVLSLRGDVVVSQPLKDPESGSLLCWNGEAWSIQGKTVDGNDAEAILNLLTRAVRETSYEQALSRIVSIISDISGPFAFVFYDALHHCVFFGRDALGRRSLAIRDTLPEGVVVSSICDTMDFKVWSEVEADGMYVLHLEGAFGSSVTMPGVIEHIPRTLKQSDIAQKSGLVC